MADDDSNQEEEKIHNVVKRWSGLYAELLSYRSNDWKALWEADPKDLILIRKMLKKAVPQVKYEYENQKRKLANNEHLAKKGKNKIGIERLNKKRDEILKDFNAGSISEEQKDALLAKLQKKEDGYKEQAMAHVPQAGVTNKLKRFGKRQEERINKMLQKHEVAGNAVANMLEHDYTLPLLFFLIYTIYFWQFAQLSFLTAIGFGVFGWIVSKIVDKSPSGGFSFSITATIFIKLIGLKFLSNPLYFLLAVITLVVVQIITHAMLMAINEKRTFKQVMGLASNVFVFFTVIWVIYPIFSQLIQLTDMGMSQKSNDLSPFLDPIKKGLNSTMTLLTDPMKWYQDYFIRKDVEKTEGVQSKALKITGMRTYLSTYYSGDEGGGSIELENFGEKPARNVKVVVYIPNDINTLMKYRGIASVLNWITPEQITYSEMDLARVSMSGASRIDEIAPKQPITLDFNIKTPATCTGGFTVISKAVYDYNMDTIGTLNVASKAKYDELSKAGELKREQMGTTSASGPISISMKTMTSMPISVDRKFAFIITPLNLDTGTVRLNSFYVYIPEEFIVYTDEKTGEYGCAFSKCSDPKEKEVGYETYMVELHGTSDRCFSKEISNLYSCHLQLKPEAAGKVIDTAEYSFKAKLSYSYALKSSAQFNVINSMILGAIEYKKCPQQVTYNDNYELLTCDKSRDYYYLCEDSIWEDIKNWAKDEWSFGDDLKHCFNYNSKIGSDVKTDLELDAGKMTKLNAIGNTATYLASRADVESSTLSAIDNEFLDNAAIIASNIDTYAMLTKRSQIEHNNIDHLLKEDIKERVNGMIEYVYTAYFLAEKNYDYDALNYAHWENRNIIDTYKTRVLPLSREDMKNLRPAGKVTKDEHIMFMGNKYVLATGALNKRVEWLNLIDYSDNCSKHYIDGPTNTRFCVKTNPCKNKLGEFISCDLKLGNCTGNNGTGICPDEISKLQTEISALISDIQTAQQKVSTIINDKVDTEEDFNDRIKPAYELNRILNGTGAGTSIIPSIIGVEMKKITSGSCPAEYPDGKIEGGDFDLCLKNVGKLCGNPTRQLTLEKLHDCIMDTYTDSTGVSTTLRELVNKINDD